MHKGLSWSPEELAMLFKLAGTMRTQDIADALSALGTPRTRHAVIGMAHRVGANLGGKPRPRKPRPKPQPIVVVHGPFSMRDLPYDACRWIDGDPRAERPFACGKKQVPPHPYCEEHMRKAEGKPFKERTHANTRLNIQS